MTTTPSARTPRLVAGHRPRRGGCLTAEARPAGRALDAELVVEQIDRRALEAQAAHGVVHGLAEQAAIDAVEVIGREAGDARERFELERVVQVLGQVVDDALDARGIGVGVGAHGKEG